MALRLGTGGLKYPLPVAPDAQQSIAAASAGGSAAASAYGANRSFAANKMRVQADLANSAAERQQRAEQAYYDRGFKAQQNFYDREHQAGAQLQMQDFRANQEELDRNFRAYQQQSGQNFQSNQANAERDFRREQNEADRQFDFETSGVEAGRRTGSEIEQGLQSGALEFPPGSGAEQELAKLERGRMEAQGKGYDAAQRAQFERTYWEEKNKILSRARPVQRPSKEDDFNQNVMEKDGVLYQRGKNGWDVLRDKPDTSKEDQRKQSWLDKRADDLMKQENDDGTPRYTPDAASRKATQDWAAREKGFQPPQPPAGMADSVRQRSGSDMPPPAPAPAPPVTVQAGQLPPPVPLPGKPVGPTPTPQTLPAQPNAPMQQPVPLGVTPSTGAGPSGTWQGPQSFNQMPRPTSAEEHAALPPGTTYVTPNGEIRKKK